MGLSRSVGAAARTGVAVGAVVLAGASSQSVASQTELDLGGLVVGAVRWRRLEGRYLPGAGETAHGYLLTDDHGDTGVRDDADVLQPWLGALWDEAPARTSAPTRTPVRAAAPTERDSTNDRGPDHDDRHAWHRNGREEQ